MLKKVVYVVGGDAFVRRMFSDTGMWNNIDERNFIGEHDWGVGTIDLICFTGGEDVSPHLYGEENIASHCNEARDTFEQEVYEEFVGKVPLVGICRGGQLLNVLNGGKMIQHIEGHHMGYRDIFVERYATGIEKHMIHEDHHQGIVEHENGEIIGYDVRDANAEIVFYRETQSLCFQPHPEWGHEGTRKLFFDLLGEYLFPKATA